MAAELKAKISLHTTEFEKGIEFAKHQAESLKETFLSTAEKIGAALGVAFSVEAFAEGIKGALEFGESLENLSARTGAPIRDLVVMQQAFRNAGLSADEVGSSINKLQKSLTGVNERGEPTNKTFEKLGLNINEIRKLNPEAQFEAVGKAIGKLQSPSERAAAAMAIFGRSGGELLALFRNGEAFGTAQEQVGKQADIMQKNAKRFEEVMIQIKNIADQFRGFFIGVASEILPKLEAIMHIIGSIHLEEMGRKFGSALSSGLNILVNAFKEGELGNLLYLTLKLGFMKWVDFSISNIQKLVAVITEALGQVMASLADLDFWKGMYHSFIATANKMAQGLIEAFGAPLKTIQDLMTFSFEKVMSGFKGGRSLSEIQKNDKLSIGGITSEGVAKVAEDETKKASESWKNFTDKGIISTNKLIEAWDKSGKGSGIFTESIKKTGEELDALAKRLNKPIEGKGKEGNGGTEGSGGTDDLINKQKAVSEKVETDRFTRLGLFTGGGSNGAIDFARRTADNTQKMAQHLATLVSKSQATMATGGASWSDD